MTKRYRGETDERQHEGDGKSESDRHGSLSGRPILGGWRRKGKDDERRKRMYSVHMKRDRAGARSPVGHTENIYTEGLDILFQTV